MSKPLSPAAQAVRDAYDAAPPDHSVYELPPDCGIRALAAAFRVAAAQMITTDDLTDTAEDIIRGAERHHQAGWLCTIATELESSNA